MLSPNQVLVGNRVSGQDNALFINQGGTSILGKDRAIGKVATTVLPIGETRGNVFHTNSGFGWYVNGHFPLNVALDGSGYVAD